MTTPGLIDDGNRNDGAGYGSGSSERSRSPRAIASAAGLTGMTLTSLTSSEGDIDFGPDPFQFPSAASVTTDDDSETEDEAATDPSSESSMSEWSESAEERRERRRRTDWFPMPVMSPRGMHSRETSFGSLGYGSQVSVYDHLALDTDVSWAESFYVSLPSAASTPPGPEADDDSMGGADVADVHVEGTVATVATDTLFHTI